MEAKHLVVGMDDLMARLKKRHPSRWDNPPPSLEQYVNIRPAKFTSTGVASCGADNVAPSVVWLVVE